MNLDNHILDESIKVSPTVLKIFDGYKYSNPKEETTYNKYSSKSDVIKEIKGLDSKTDYYLKSILSTKNNIAVLSKKLKTLKRSSVSDFEIRKTEKDKKNQEEKIKKLSEQYELNNNMRQYLFNKISMENIVLYKTYCEAAAKVLSNIYNKSGKIDKLNQKLRKNYILLFVSTLPNNSKRILSNDISAINIRISSIKARIALYLKEYNQIVNDKNIFLDTVIK